MEIIMEDDYDMRRIATPLFSGLLTNVGITTSIPTLFVPYGHLTLDFYQNIRVALLAKKTQVLSRWQTFFEKSCLNALSSHEIYLRYVMFAGYIEIKFSNNVFDELLGVFALVMNFNVETLINSWVNFCEFSVDIFMVFYEKILRKRFYEQGGFQQFAEYLRNNGIFPGGNHDLSNHKTFPQISNIKHTDVMANITCKSLVRKLLSTTNLKLPALANPLVLQGRLQAARQQKAASAVALSTNHQTCPKTSIHETTGLAFAGETSERSLKRKVEETDWNQEAVEASKVNETTETATKLLAKSVNGSGMPDTHAEWIQHIANTVVEFYNSRCKDPAHAEGRFHKEANKFLNQLQGMVQSLANVLQNYDHDEE